MLSEMWRRPPPTLVALIAAITVVPLLTLLWLGWRLLEQDRLLEQQPVQQRRAWALEPWSGMPEVRAIWTPASA